MHTKVRFCCRCPTCIPTLYTGPKTSVHIHLNYLVIVSPPLTANATSASATIRSFAARNVGASGTEVTKVTVFDLENKFVAHSEAFTEGVREVFSQWSNIYVLSNDGKLSCLQEKPTATKLDMLYRRGYYVLALDIAKTQQMSKESVADIHRQYGDYLYGKPDHDAAMHQYLQTIGYVQPSYVIRKVCLAIRSHAQRSPDSGLVFRCATYSQPRHLSSRIAFARSGQL
jgi:vacuolar protein sorting-associated protein 11